MGQEISPSTIFLTLIASFVILNNNYPEIILKCEQTATDLHIILNLFLQQLVSDTDFTWKIAFYGRISGLTACLALVCKAADETRITISFFFKSFGINKINELTVSSNKLIFIVVGWSTRSFVPGVARGPPIGSP
jgi:hypothetical protein